MQLIDTKTREKIIARDGAKDILLHFMEEVGEMLTKVNHVKRGKSIKENLEKEIADVIICLEFVKQILSLNEKDIDYFIEETIKKMQTEVSGNSSQP